MAECGLKFIYLKRNNSKSIKDLVDFRHHDLRKLVKGLKISEKEIDKINPIFFIKASNIRFEIKDFHEALRYGATIMPEGKKECVEWLKELCELLKKKILELRL
jgi:hypothetical protein